MSWSQRKAESDNIHLLYTTYGLHLSQASEILKQFYLHSYQNAKTSSSPTWHIYGKIHPKKANKEEAVCMLHFV